MELYIFDARESLFNATIKAIRSTLITQKESK